jgi:hypothetical protein
VGSFRETVAAAAALSKSVSDAALERLDERRQQSVTMTAIQRARAAKQRELDALDEALRLHQAAAAMQRTFRHPERAIAADARAASCREAMVLARQERDEAERLQSAGKGDDASDEEPVSSA